MDGFGEKSASNIMRSIDKSREVEAHRLLYALNIPLCGLDVCKRLLSAYPLDELVAMATVPDSSPSGSSSGIPVEGDLFAAPVESSSPASSPSDVFAHIDGIGPEKSAQFVLWFRNEHNLARYRRLLTKLTVTTPDISASGDKCASLTFVITGDVHHYKNRNELKAYIESQGGKVASAVSGSTSYLINNDVTSTSGKNKKAQQLGIPIISEDDFIAQYATVPTTE
jgi:DNA ligase (NAD+)